MEFGFIEEYGSVYNITVKHPSIEIPATLRAVPAISITIGSHTVSNSLAPDIEGCFVTWRESLTVSGITKGTRQLTLQLFLEDQSQWVSVTTTISFATQRKRIIVGDQFSKGYLDLRIQTLKNELTSIEALRTPRATRLASNIQIDLTQRIINEVAEDDIEDLPLEGIDSFLQQNSQITQTPVTQNSQPLIEVFTPKAIETSLIKLTPGCVSEIVQSICEPTALTLETLPQMIALELCPVPLNDFCVGDDEVVLFGLEEFEQNRFRSRTCYHPTASSFCQDQSQPLNRTTLACQLVESPPQAISQPQTSSVQEQHAFIVADNVGDCLFIDTVSEDSSQSGSHQQLVMSTPITINAHQQTEQSSEMVVQKNSQQIDYSMQQEEVMEEHPRHEVEAKSTKFLEKWPQVLECCSDSDRQIERLVHQELSNIRCRVAIAEACADKLTIKAADPSVSKIPPAAVRQEERASRNVQPTPLAASTIIPQKEDQVIVQPDKKQIRPANISNVGQVEQQRFDPLKEFAKSLRSAYGDKIYENKSATTLQKSVLCYSVPKANRFLKARVQDTGTTYFTGSCFQNSKAKGTSFGFGNRKAYPLWLERNMKENPAPNSYQEVQGSSPRLPKGYSFGLSYHYYQKASIFEAQQPKKSPTMPAINKLRSKSRRDIYASLTKQTGSGGNYHFMSGSQLARAGGLR